MARRRDIDRLEGEIQDLFADLWQLPRLHGLREGFRPPVDCYRTEDPPALTVVVDLAGVDPESIRLIAGGRALLIEGERHRPTPPSRASFQRLEIDYGPFCRRVALGADVDPEAAEASYVGGMLTVVLPLREPAPSDRRVAIPVEARRG
ncbi:MAG: Hsp20/alpha crystallin family protein [Gaiellaceae bacterium]